MPEGVPMTMILARWAAELALDDLAEEVVHQAKRVILDYLAAVLAGSSSEPARLVQEYLFATENTGAATVFGASRKLTPSNAAIANGTAAHSLEVDDGYTPGAHHPGAPNLSAILAAAQGRGSPAEDVLLATVVGFELSCRIAGAGHPATWANGFHNTPIAGVFGAAAGVTKLFDGDAEVMANALGLAGSHASGLFEFLGRGDEVKRYHAGKAGRDGLVCAELALRGLTGPTTVLEGTRGYFRAFAGDDFDASFLLDGLGEDWHMMRTYVKPYPCCRHLHGPIDAILALQEQGPVDVGGISRVSVETYQTASQHSLTNIESLLDAQLSIPYAVAVTLLAGLPTLEHFGEDWRQDPRVATLIDKVEVSSAEDCEKDYPNMRPARVTIHSGELERGLRIDQPYGEPSNPVTDADLEAKLVRLAGPVVGNRACTRIIEEVWSFDDPQRLFAELGARDGSSQ